MTAKILAGVALLAMFEDVEIMRRIMQQSVNDMYQGRASVTLTGDDTLGIVGALHSQQPGSHGVYLPGYGVLIQATVPFALPQGSSAEAKDERASQWEKVRRELRGKSPPGRSTPALATRAPDTPTRDQLTRRVLEVLAENGRHFRELPAEERLTVDIVFHNRDKSRSTKPHDQQGYLWQGMGPGQSKQSAEWQLGWSGNARRPEQGFLFITTSSAEENAGDLHMRQKNYAKAVEAYAKALKTHYDPDVAPGIARSLYKKLAQAHVGAGQYDEAQQYLGLLNEGAGESNEAYGSQVQSLAAFDAESGRSIAALPAHLIVSATKEQLDAVASGKMSREEFRQTAQIEYLDPLEAAAESKGKTSKTSKAK